MRSQFRETVDGYPDYKLYYFDDCRIAKCLYREYAYAPRGVQTAGKISGKKLKRANVVAAKRGDKVIMDNAPFHRKAKLRELAEKAKCDILFLPPYSPDLSPIENFWAWLKRKLRSILHSFDNFDDPLVDCFRFE